MANQRGRGLVDLDVEAQGTQLPQPLGIDLNAQERELAVALEVLAPRGDLTDGVLAAEPGADHPGTGAGEGAVRQHLAAGEAGRDQQQQRDEQGANRQIPDRGLH